MIYKHAVLGETPELFKETAEWVHEELERIERNERAAGKVMESIQPLLDKKGKSYKCAGADENTSRYSRNKKSRYLIDLSIKDIDFEAYIQQIRNIALKKNR